MLLCITIAPDFVHYARELKTAVEEVATITPEESVRTSVAKPLKKGSKDGSKK